MFTGLVETVGTLCGRGAERLRIRPAKKLEALRYGESVAVNGCCLTLVGRDANELSFELLEETIRLTSFEGVKAGTKINLERPLAANARLGGHFVSGHIDVRSKVEVFEQKGKNFYLKVAVPKEFSKYYFRSDKPIWYEEYKRKNLKKEEHEER